jgi:PAS domain S-box-containing protein
MEKKKVLIVEDNPIVAEDIKTALQGMGYEVTATAYSGIDALKSAELEPPDIALMDIRLGKGMNGIDTAGELKQKYGISVIYLTALADGDTLARAKITEPYGYIVKPFDDDELKSVIEIALYKQESDRKVQDSQQWLQTTLNSIGDGVIATDGNGNITFMNPVAVELTGWSQNEVAGKPLEEVFQIINEDTRKTVENPVKKVLKKGVVVGLANHTLLITKDGKEFPITDSGAPIINNKGDIIGVVLVFRDQIKERKAENILRESEERFRILVESSPQLIMLGQKGKYIYANPAAVKLLGYEDSQELIGMDALKTVSPDFRDAVIERIKNIDHKKNSEPTETKMIKKNGDEIWFLTHSANVDIKRQPTAIIVGQEITSRIKAERNYKRLATAINHIAEGVEITDTEPSIVYVNPAFEHITGYSKDEILGRNPSILQSGHHNQLFYKDMWDELLEKKIWHGRFQNKRKDGSLYYEEASISPVVDEKGEIINYVAVKRDVTAEMESENRLKQAQKMEAIGTLAGGIAHDFNNILSSIIGFTELALNDTKKGTDLEDDLQEVYAAGKRAKDLVKQILTFARQADEKVQPVQVSTIAKEVHKFIRASIPTTIQIETIIDSDSLIMGSTTQVHQIFMNLFTNASHAMEDKGGLLQMTLKDVTLNRNEGISIRGLKPGNYLQVEISDTGQGIPEHILQSIFEPYFTTKRVGEGTGMGLAVVHGIVESYGGKIMVDSKLAKGTTFTIYFPIAKKRNVQSPYEIEDLPLGKEHVLFIDDEAPIVKMGSRVLEQLGYTVTTRTDSLEALSLFRSNPDGFDVVVSDMTMPNLTGDKLAAELIKIRSDIPFILCTGYSKNISDKIASEIGIKAFAYKPIVKADLAKTIRKVLDETKSSL